MSETTAQQAPDETIDLDTLMEQWSDMVRKGEPVSFLQAIAVIEYQERRKAERAAIRAQTCWGRFLNWMGRAAPDETRATPACS